VRHRCQRPNLWRSCNGSWGHGPRTALPETNLRAALPTILILTIAGADNRARFIKAPMPRVCLGKVPSSAARRDVRAATEFTREYVSVCANVDRVCWPHRLRGHRRGRQPPPRLPPALERSGPRPAPARVHARASSRSATSAKAPRSAWRRQWETARWSFAQSTPRSLQARRTQRRQGDDRLRASNNMCRLRFRFALYRGAVDAIGGLTGLAF
jgi:hypothetical protein